jgi:phosphoribosylformylglycinamidine synthase subunit PurSL
VSVFEDNAGVVRFDDTSNVVFKVETHNHPSALEPYGGANTGIGGVIRDPLGTGMGAKPICNTDVFCFAPPTPRPVNSRRAYSTRAGDAGSRLGGARLRQPDGHTDVNGAVLLRSALPGQSAGLLRQRRHTSPGQVVQATRSRATWIVAIGGRTGRDGIHGATFSSAELTSESETLSGGAVQIGNAITEKMLLDVLLQARDRGLYHAVTDCGAGGFSSAVGEMGEKIGADVQLDAAPLKYEGLSYTEIWISEAQERMVLAVPPENWEAFRHAVRGGGGGSRYPRPIRADRSARTVVPRDPGGRPGHGVPARRSPGRGPRCPYTPAVGATAAMEHGRSGRLRRRPAQACWGCSTLPARNG